MKKSINTLLNRLEVKYKYDGYAYLDTNSAISYDMRLYTKKLYEIIRNGGANNKEATIIIDDCITESIKNLANKLATETFAEKLDKINQLLIKQPLSITDITKITKSPVHTYDTMNEIISMLTYEDTHPLELFSDFVREYEIDFCVDKEHKGFKFKIDNDMFSENPEKWYNCKNITTCLSICRNIMLDKLCEEYRDFQFDSSFQVLPSNFIDIVDKDLHSSSCKDLYLYLASNKFIKMNVGLSNLYLLIYCEEFTALSDKTIMKKIYSSIVKAEKISKNRDFDIKYNFKDILEEKK